jgi:hypothetical protein
MRVKHLATKSSMAKTSATNWVRSTITKKEVEKATVDDLIAAEDSIKFPSTERIPKPPSGYRVMFLAFLFRGLSLPAHNFSVGCYLSTVCSSISSHQIPFFTLLVS